MLFHRNFASTTKLVGPHAARTVWPIAAASIPAGKSAKHALPLPLIRATNPNSSRNCSSNVGSATNFSNATGSMLLKSNISAALSPPTHAAKRASASASGK